MTKLALITGAAGYIGSHACVKLIEDGYSIIAFDNFSNGKRENLTRVFEVAGTDFPIVEGDVRSISDLKEIDKYGVPDIAFHFAGLKSVNESICLPEIYYDVNVFGSLALAKYLAEVGCRNLVFSSSATVYGDSEQDLISECSAINPTNPYGRSKNMAEIVLSDICMAQGICLALLRYFNPIGAHPSGLIGEDPCGIPNNLLPYIVRVASGQYNCLNVYGSDWNTEDGTGVRDYIHVMDLVDGHIAAANYIMSSKTSLTVNLGTGKGTSVLQLISAFEAATGTGVKKQHVARRSGDVARAVANPEFAANVLGWTSRRTILEACADSWRWQMQIKNKGGPDG